jgi:hypothetical protein
MLRRILLAAFFLFLAGKSWAGTNLLDASGNSVWADIQSLNIATAISGDTNPLTLRGQATAFVQVTANSTTLQFEGTVAGGTFTAIPCVVPTTNLWVTSTTATGVWQCPISGLATFRLRQSAAGASTSSVIASQGTAVVFDIIGYAQNAATSGQTNILAGGAVTTAAPSYTNANTSPLSLTTAGALRSDLNSVASTTVVTAAAGVQKVGVVGNANGAFDAANNAAAPANLVVEGAQLQSGAQATAGTAGQVGNILAGLDHVQYSRNGGPVVFSCFKEAITVTTECQVASGAGLKNYVTSVNCSNEAATVQTVDVVFGTGANCATGITALTHKFQMGTVATTTSPFDVEATFPTPLNPTAANAICVRPSAATAFGCTVTGFIAP